MSRRSALRPRREDPAGPTLPRRPLASVWLLAFGAFAVGTGLFALGGVLPALATAFHVTQATAGQSVTVFAVAYIVGAPVAAYLGARWPTRRVLLVGLATFTLGNAATAAAPNLVVLFLSRVVSALGAATFTPVALGAAVALVPAPRRGQALAIVMSGLNGALAVGVPLGVVLSRIGSWRSAVVLVAALGLTAIIVIFLGIRHLPAGAPTSLPRAAAMLRRRSVLVVLGVTVLAVAAGICAYTYIADILDQTAGATSNQYLLLLVVYGVGAFCGSLGAGPFTDRFGPGRALVSSVSLLIVTLLLVPVATSFTAAALLMLVWGAAFTACITPQQYRLVGLVPDDATVAVSFNSSATYLGQAVGAATGGIALSAGLARRDLPFLAAGLAVCALIVHLTATPSSSRRGIA